MSDAVERLRSIKTFPGLIKYLRDDLDWPIESDDVDDLTFEYQPEELGLDAKHAVKIKEIKQLRPLDSKQPWGIFWVNFEKKRLPMVVLRRVLGNLVVKKRKSANKTDRPNWQLNDLLFISSYGEEEHRTISFAHFSEDPGTDELPVLRVLGWDDQNSIMHLDRVANRLHTQFRWPDEPAALEAWRKRWSEAFTDRYQEAIRSAAELIPRLARLARTVRKRVKDTLDAESEHGPMRRLLAAVRGLLIHDMNEDAFADMYAQTVAYGLLSARFSRPADLTAQNLVQLTSVSNPFLENLLENLFRLNRGKFHFDVDEVGINDVLDLLRKTNIEAIKAAFNDENPAEDPVIRFYEGFLKEYDPKQRIQRGIFFTPRPVVSYIVRSVHELLQTEFNLDDGLASTATWADMLTKFPDLKLPAGVKPEDPFVCILDPATGTGTFLFTCIEVIERTMKDKWCRELGKKSWNDPEILKRWRDYVPRYLLPRLYGYELMMAPYAIAHLKLALKLGETGYQFREGDRLHIYLTNSLEPASELADPKLADLFATLAKEAQEVNLIKQHKRFTVVLGNPPYARHSANPNRDTNGRLTFIGRLVEEYKEGCPELRKPAQAKYLQDDYVKFIRLSEYILEQAKVGIFGLITNHGFLDNPTFRGLRNHLLQRMCLLSILDLHGNANKKEICPDGSEDVNVFDIKQGVAITLAAKWSSQGFGAVHHGNLWGTREQKYDRLAKSRPVYLLTDEPRPKPPMFFLCPRDERHESEYLAFPSIRDVFALNGDPAPGIVTTHDSFAVAFSREEIVENVEQFLGTRNESEARQYFQLCTQSQWNYGKAKRELADGKWRQKVIPLYYRPFDIRFTVYDSNVAVHRRERVTWHLLERGNTALLTSRMTKGETFKHVQVTRLVPEVICMSPKTSNNGFVFPLWLRPEKISQKKQGGLLGDRLRPNLGGLFLDRLCRTLKLRPFGKWGLPEGVSPEDVFNYIYSVFHSGDYRQLYAEFLKSDFPRLPLPRNLDLFSDLAKLGSELVTLHLVESPRLDKHITEFVGRGDSEVAKGYPKYKDRTVWINETQGFKGVPEDVWTFHIGGYQVCEKWLKDRRSRKLSKEDIDHYHRIVVALKETIRLMAEIDKVIEKYGGWLGAFVSGAEKETRKEADLPLAAESSVSYRKGECGN